MKTLKHLFILCVVALPGLSHAQYILTLHCAQMDPYIGKTFKVRVTEIGTGYEVGRKTIDALQTATFSIDLYVLLQNESYEVDFYVDVNGNGSYDTPPVDPAWRRIVNNATQSATINFTNDLNYTNIAFPDDLPFGTYDAVWGGRWKNLTFGSTDSIQAAFNLTCDSVIASFSTKGVFGNPATVQFGFADTVSSNLDLVHDTIHYSPGLPWTGEVYIINGEIHGSLELTGFELAFTGTVGLKQLICLYTVSTGGTVFANGYFYLRELEIISMSPPLTLELTSMPISCSGVLDGSLWSEVGGGTGNYSYQWLPTGGTTPHQESIGAGEYTLIVTDDQGCSIEASYTLSEPQPLIIESIDVVNASCPEACDAVITVLATGGVPPYSYAVEGESCTGPVTIIAMDANGCTDSEDIIIDSDSNIELFEIHITDATEGQSNGSVEVIVGGGIPPYQYSLDGIVFQLSSLFNGLPPGAYCISIKDENGCSFKTDTFLIDNITGVVDIMPHLQIYPNPASTNLHLESDSPLTIDLIDTHSHILKHIPPSGMHDLNIAEFPRGIYFLRISDGSGYAFQKIILH